MNRIMSGKSSSLPASMSKISTTLESGEKIEKFCAGPTRFKPGPMLFRHETTAVKFVVKSNSSRLKISVDSMSRIK